MSMALMRGWVLTCVCMASSLGSAAFAAGENPQGFNTPEGYTIVRSAAEAYGVFVGRNQFQCIDKTAWVKCGPKFGPFSAEGIPKIEGQLERVSYKTADQASSGLLLYRNYERVIQDMGGHLVARMFGHNERSGKLRFLFLLPGTQQKWVIFETWGLGTGEMNLTVLTSTEIPNILTAGELQNQLDTAGFATLNVNFETNQSTIRAEDKPALDQVRELLQSTPSLRLSVDGHTDNVGSAPANKSLSRDRASAIVDYLKRAGIEPSRLKPQGFGAEAPIADNRSEDGRAKNRRVELVKLK